MPQHNSTTLPKHQEGDKEMQSLIEKNKVFECLTLLKPEVIEYEKMGFKMA